MKIVQCMIKLFSNKCVFCNKTEKESGEELLHIGYSDEYDSQWYWYHEHCFKNVLNNPERHIEQVDTAIKIDELLSNAEYRLQKKLELAARAKTRRVGADE